MICSDLMSLWGQSARVALHSNGGGLFRHLQVVIIRHDCALRLSPQRLLCIIT